jgi:heme exporter protein CcmD
MTAAMFPWGKYGAYVWPAYGITLVAIAAAVLWVWRSYRRAEARLADADKIGAARPNEA